MTTTPTDAAQTPPPSIADIAEIIVTALGLEMTPDEIDPDAPLFGEGLGLDSIDILEIALVISKRYGIQLRADNDNNTTIFSSLRNLTDYVVSQLEA
ncbi:phosphopantetheine-binding protein [Zoogloea sp.]|uniref:phosphopantetheine-binding protein n=1 Tax=Zoogloea sp. TaxID=49181 RepID=UPI00262B2478|nr:phosphopantetheine-binding protein [Zoogloea sp.]